MNYGSKIIAARDARGAVFPEYAIALFLIVVALSAALAAMNVAINRRAESSMGIVSDNGSTMMAPCSRLGDGSTLSPLGGECL